MRMMIGIGGLGSALAVTSSWRILCALGIAMFLASFWQMFAAIGAARVDIIGLPYPADEANVARWSALAGLGALVATIAGIRV
jgi:hypothetical protein